MSLYTDSLYTDSLYTDSLYTDSQENNSTEVSCMYSNPVYNFVRCIETRTSTGNSNGNAY